MRGDRTVISEQGSGKTGTIVFSIVAAYLFAVLSRLTLLFDAMKHPEYFFNGKIIPIWTADAGYVGAHAKRLLAGEYVPSDNEHMAGHLIAWMSNLSGLPVDTVLFYAPALLAALIVIPIVLIMALYRLTLTGMLAAMLASVGFNFYFRTHLGYADTDMLNFFFVFMLLYSMIAVAEKRSLSYGWIGFAAIVFLSLWYHSYKPLIVGILPFYAGYILILDRKNLAHYYALILYVIAFLPLPIWIRLALAVPVAFAWYFRHAGGGRLSDYRYWLFATISGVVAAGIYLAAHPRYYDRIVAYLGGRETVAFSDVTGTQYVLKASLKGISEAMAMPLPDTVIYMSGSFWLLAFGIAGLLLLARYRRSSLLLWPMLLLGFAATVLGVRFTTFAVAVVAIGVFVLLRVLLQILSSRFGKKMALSVTGLLSAAVFAYAFSKVTAYNAVIRPVYLADEAALMEKLASAGSPDDFIVDWWDDGWPLWYGTGKRTLIDNGKHGMDNYIVAKIWFTPNPVLSVNMARYFLQRHADRYDRASVFKRVGRQTDLQTFMQRLSRLPLVEKPPFDIYFYFRDDMIERLPLIAEFSKLNGRDPFANELFSYTYMLKPFHTADRKVEAKGIVFDRRTGTVQTADGQVGRVARLIVSDGKRIKVRRFYKNSDYNLIVYKNRYLLMLTDKYLDTFVIKSLLLNQYDPHLFAHFGSCEHANVLRLR